MSMDQLPDKVINLEVLRINHNIDKRCKCQDRNFVVDSENREVTCGKCGARLDPFDSLAELARSRERITNENRRLLEERKQIINYKPHMLVFRGLEKEYRGKKMIPYCPHCHRGFFFEEISGWTNREMEERRRQKEKDEPNI